MSKKNIIKSKIKGKAKEKLNKKKSDIAISAIKKIALLAIPVAILIVVLRIVGFEDILSTIKQTNIIFVILSFLCILGMFLSWNLRWSLTVKKLADSNFFAIFPVLLAGSFVNNTSPGARVGGEPLRAHYLSKMYKVSRTKFLGTTFVDKLTASIVFSFFSVFSVLFVILFLNINKTIKLIFQSGIIIVFIIVLLVILFRNQIITQISRISISKILKFIYEAYIFKSVTKRFNTFKSFEKHGKEKINNVTESFQHTLNDRSLFKRCIFWGLVMWLFNYLGTFMLFLSFDQWVNPLAVIIVVSLSLVIGSFAIVPGGMGVTEAIMISLYVAFGIDPGVAAAVAVIDRAIYYFYSMIAGFVSLIYLQIRYP